MKITLGCVQQTYTSDMGVKYADTTNQINVCTDGNIIQVFSGNSKRIENLIKGKHSTSSQKILVNIN